MVASVTRARHASRRFSVNVPAQRPPFPPVEPASAVAFFPDPRLLGPNEVAAVSRTMNPSIVLAAYRRGIFPWPVSSRVVPWVSPDPRAVLAIDRPLHWSRSLRRTLRSDAFTVTHDRAFRAVMKECGRLREDGTWITSDVMDTYSKLHDLGWAHSVEVWSTDDGSLVGGIYGVSIGGMFAGESMFHRRTDASKVAFAHLAQRLVRGGYLLFDVQVLTEHLASLGCESIPRREFLTRLDRALAVSARFTEDDEEAAQPQDPSQR